MTSTVRKREATSTVVLVVIADDLMAVNVKSTFTTITTTAAVPTDTSIEVAAASTMVTMAIIVGTEIVIENSSTRKTMARDIQVRAVGNAKNRRVRLQVQKWKKNLQ